MAENLVKFKQGTALDYAGLGVKDPNTLYFITDEHVIYKGETSFAGYSWKFVSDPSSAANNQPYTFYVSNQIDGLNCDYSIYYYNHEKAQTVPLIPSMRKSMDSTISASSSHDKVPTAKAVYDFIQGKLSDLDVGKIIQRVDALEATTASHTAALGTIQGSGAGSIKKAEQDAKTAAQGYANTAETNAKAEVTKLANGQVNTNKTDIAGLKSGKADKATTLAGYGITDAYTKSGTTAEINRIVGSAGHLKRQVVAVRPSVSEANVDTIYMVKTSSSDTESSYTEWMVIEGVWEKIGDTKVDLSPYAKTATVNSQISTAKSEAISTAAGDATTKANSAEANAKKYADGLAGNYATAAQGKKADSALQSSDIIEGTTQGAIHVKGAAVKVHGLGSAAYTASSAYATSTQGGKADTALQKSDISTGSTNGTIAVKGADVAVKGLGTAAYTNSGAYASSAQGAKADSAATALAGLSGTVASNISAAEGRAKSYADGLAGNYDTKGSAASAESNAKSYADGLAKNYDKAGAASTAESNAKSYTNTCLTWGAI